MLPNGMAISKDLRRLIVAETFAHRLLSFDIAADGGLGKPDVLLDLGSGGPDGICMDALGGLWVALPLDRSVVYVTEEGKVTHKIPMPERNPVSCALGGPDGTTLFICTCRIFKKKGMMTPDEAREIRPGCIEVVDVGQENMSRWLIT